MDEKDIRILYTAIERGTQSPEDISNAIDVPKSTVHYRLENLKQEGVIKNELLDVDITDFGMMTKVISEIQAEYDEGYHNIVGDQLAEIEGINQVYFVMGDTDFVVIANIHSREMVEELISSYESIDEIKRTSSRFVIKTIKANGQPIRDFDLDTLIEGFNTN
jgi:DNA-binding Lrp family transcriptional regulator